MKEMSITIVWYISNVEKNSKSKLEKISEIGIPKMH